MWLWLLIAPALLLFLQTGISAAESAVLNGYVYQRVERGSALTLPYFPIWILPDSPEVRSRIQPAAEEADFAGKLDELERFRAVTERFGTLNRTGADGYFRLELPAGRYLILSQSPYISANAKQLTAWNERAAQGDLRGGPRLQFEEWAERADLYPFPLFHGYWVVEAELVSGRLTVDLNWYNLRDRFECCLEADSWHGPGLPGRPERRGN